MIGSQILIIAENIKARIVKCGDGMEKGKSDGFSEREIPNENEKAEARAEKLKDHRRDENITHKGHESAPRVKIQGFFDKRSSLYIHFLSHGKNDARANGGKPKAAHLNEERQEKLSERGKGIACINGDKTRYANGAGRGI